MRNRISKRLVTFAHPFTLEGIEEEWPAGDYTIETEEEALDSISFQAFRTVSTTMIFRSRKGTTRFIEIAAAELEAALERDKNAASSFRE